MKTAPKITFGNWLQQSLRLMGRLPWLWASYTLFIAVLLLIGHVSPVLGIFSATVCLLVGVGLAKYTELRTSAQPIRFSQAIRNSLPLAVIAAASFVGFWFVFVALANLLSGQFEKIGQFFIHWEFTDEHLKDRSIREISAWIYGYANAALILGLLLLNTYVSWFSYPLMLFKDTRFSQAKQRSEAAIAKCQGPLYKLIGFIFIEAVLCLTVTPLLTPVLYALTSSMMYISYKSMFEAE